VDQPEPAFSTLACKCTAQQALGTCSRGDPAHLCCVHALSGSRDSRPGAGAGAGGGGLVAALVGARPQDGSQQPARLLLRKPVRALQQPAVPRIYMSRQEPRVQRILQAACAADGASSAAEPSCHDAIMYLRKIVYGSGTPAKPWR
jgi:hypothetical protein